MLINFNKKIGEVMISVKSYPFAHGSTYGVTLSVGSSEGPDLISRSEGTSVWVLIPQKLLVSAVSSIGLVGSQSSTSSGSTTSLVSLANPVMKELYPIKQIEIHREKYGNIKIFVQMEAAKTHSMIFYARMFGYLTHHKIACFESSLFFRERIFYLEQDGDARKLLNDIRDRNDFTPEAQEVMKKALAPISMRPFPKRVEENKVNASDDVFVLK